MSKKKGSAADDDDKVETPNTIPPETMPSDEIEKPADGDSDADSDGGSDGDD